LLGWGTVFVDLDNNGWLDLVAANGHVEDRTWESAAEPYRMRPLVYRNEQNGMFRDITSWCGEYCVQEWLGRGLAAGDLDRDGLVDLVVSHQLAPSLVLRNETRSQAPSVTLRLVGTASVRNGYGARVRIADDRSGVRELFGGGSFHSAGALEIHLGLGEQAAVPIQVIWPSGETDTFTEVTAGTWGIVQGRPQIIRLVAEVTR
jgi:hypothetical protein